MITHRVISLPCREPRVYPIARLSQVHAVQVGPCHPVGPHRVLGVAALASVFVTVPVLGAVSAVLAAVIALASLVYAGACLRVRPEMRYQLVATVDGERVTLVDTADRTEFDQVARGLVRAVEYWRDHP
jgi:hypothetical protein